MYKCVCSFLPHLPGWKPSKRQKQFITAKHASKKVLSIHTSQVISVPGKFTNEAIIDVDRMMEIWILCDILDVQIAILAFDKYVLILPIRLLDMLLYLASTLGLIFSWIMYGNLV